MYASPTICNGEDASKDVTRAGQYFYMLTWQEWNYALDSTIFACRHAGVLSHPHHALHGPFVRQRSTGLKEEVRFCVWPPQIEHPDFLLLATCEQVHRTGRDGHAADDMVVRKRMQRFPTIRIPYFTASTPLEPRMHDRCTP